MGEGSWSFYWQEQVLIGLNSVVMIVISLQTAAAIHTIHFWVYHLLLQENRPAIWRESKNGLILLGLLWYLGLVLRRVGFRGRVVVKPIPLKPGVLVAVVRGTQVPFQKSALLHLLQITESVMKQIGLDCLRISLV